MASEQNSLMLRQSGPEEIATVITYKSKQKKREQAYCRSHINVTRKFHNPLVKAS